MYDKILCTISGGSDSDVMLDICTKCDKDNKIDYVWFDTGLEYQATKDHLKYLEEKYKIEIKIYKAIKPIPISCREFGQPFLSKRVSDYISRLQKHGFQWEDESLMNLLNKYCICIPPDKAKDSSGKLRKRIYEYRGKYYRGCCAALMWWCNEYGENSKFNISYNKYLKEFIVQNPPLFKMSDKCCKFAKKDVAGSLIKEEGYDLNIMGLRKAEGGVRSTAYKSCFSEYIGGCDYYRPLFWYKNSDKEDYEKCYGIVHSKCYTEYGLKRTGCSGCPFGRDFEQELEIIQKYEPKLFIAVNNIFGDSYEYTRKYREFCKRMDNNKK